MYAYSKDKDFIQITVWNTLQMYRALVLPMATVCLRD